MPNNPCPLPQKEPNPAASTARGRSALVVGHWIFIGHWAIDWDLRPAGLFACFAGKSGFVQCQERLFGIEITRDIKGLGPFGSGVALHALDLRQSVLHTGDALVAAEMHAVNLERLHLPALGPALRHNLH